MPNPKGNIATLKSYKPKWNTGATRTIRVPIALADQTLDYAHKLDNNSLTQVDDSQNILKDVKLQETLTQVIQVLESVCETPNTSKFTKALKAKLQNEAIAQLKALTHVNEVTKASENLA